MKNRIFTLSHNMTSHIFMRSAHFVITKGKNSDFMAYKLVDIT